MMKIDMTDQEYRSLLHMLQMADWVLHAHVVDPPDDEYAGVLQKFMALAKDYKCDDLVHYDEAHDCYEPTDEYFLSEEIHDPIDKHDEEIFWDELVERLATRDVMQEIGLIEYGNLDPLERGDRISEAEEKYGDEFSAHGLKRLHLNISD